MFGIRTHSTSDNKCIGGRPPVVVESDQARVYDRKTGTWITYVSRWNGREYVYVEKDMKKDEKQSEVAGNAR